jgi:hypothetical protein
MGVFCTLKAGSLLGKMVRDTILNEARIGSRFLSNFLGAIAVDLDAAAAAATTTEVAVVVVVVIGDFFRCLRPPATAFYWLFGHVTCLYHHHHILQLLYTVLYTTQAFKLV